MRKILLVFLMLVLATGPVWARPEAVPSPDTTPGHAKIAKKTTGKKAKSKKAKKSSKKPKKRSKNKGKNKKAKDDSGKALGSEIDHKAVTLDLENDGGI